MNVGPERRESPLVRSYVHTRGRARPEHPVDVATLVRAVATGGTPELDPDRRRLVRICQGGALAAAELAAHLQLPLTVTLVMIGDLITDGYLTASTPTQTSDSALPSPELLQEVLNGLRRLDTSA